MVDSAENKMDTHFNILRFFQSAVSDKVSGASSPGYQKAVASLTSFLKVRDRLSDAITEDLLADWLAFMYVSGISFNTANLYLNSISGLYKKAVVAGYVAHTVAFKNIKAKFKLTEGRDVSYLLTDSDFVRMVNLCKSAPNRTGDESKVIDVILFSLVSGCRPVTEVATLTVPDTESLGDDARTIVERNSDTRRKYIFDLKQSQLTPRRLSRNLHDLVVQLFKERNLPFFDTVDETLRSYWAFAALKYGLSAATVVSCLGKVPVGVPVLSVSSMQEIPGIRKNAINRAVGEMFTANPLRWYAMRLRPRVKFEELDSRFMQLRDELSRPDMFYPCEEIAKRTGKKLRFEKKPVIADIVFFRSRVTDIFPMFTKIGDLAWCYTAPGSHGKTYAAIPTAAFRQFQETIGQFTPEYEVANIGELQPGHDDKVVVIGGLFQGHEADFKEIDTTEDDNTIYRLQFFGDNGFEWRIGVDRRLLRKKA